jgi:hypothetical protein
MRKSSDIESDIEWLEGALDTANVYQSDIFDVVSTVRQVPMLDHNRNYINAIEVKIKELRADLKEAKEWEADYES